MNGVILECVVIIRVILLLLLHLFHGRIIVVNEIIVLSIVLTRQAYT